MLTIDELKEKLAKNVRERNELVALAKYHGYKIEFKAHEIKNQNFGFICPQEYEYTLTLNCLVPGIATETNLAAAKHDPELALTMWGKPTGREHVALYRSASPSPVGESRDALIERLVKALSAFAEAADIFEREYGDKMKPDTGCNIKFSALCEARAVLASKEQQS